VQDAKQNEFLKAHTQKHSSQVNDEFSSNFSTAVQIRQPFVEVNKNSERFNPISINSLKSGETQKQQEPEIS